MKNEKLSKYFVIVKMARTLNSGERNVLKQGQLFEIPNKLNFVLAPKIRCGSHKIPSRAACGPRV